MQAITLEIEDEVLEKAAVIAAQKGITVEAMVLEFLTDIARREEARKKRLDLIDRSEGRMKPGWKFNREATYDR